MRSLLAELAPCFVEDAGGRTDVVALACTHYPLLLPRFQALAPWPVTWIDPAPAIARRVMQLIGAAGAGPRGRRERDRGRVHERRRAIGLGPARGPAGRGLAARSTVEDDAARVRRADASALTD